MATKISKALLLAMLMLGTSLVMFTPPADAQAAVAYSISFTNGQVQLDVRPGASGIGCTEMVISNEGQATIDVDISLSGGGVTISPGELNFGFFSWISSRCDFHRQNISDLLRGTVSSKINNDKKKKALVLSPHTDDAELGCGGTIAKLTEEGWNVHVIYFSAVAERYPNLVEEAANSGKILGITHEVLDFHTRFFPRDRQEILQALYDHSRSISYDLVFTPTTTDIHQDHGVVTAEAKRAFRNCTLLGYELPWNNLSVSLNCFIPLEERHIKKKILALDCYNSQKHNPYFNEKFFRSVVKMRGIQLSSPFAEGFETIKVRLDQLI